MVKSPSPNDDCLKDSTIYIFTYTADPEQYEEYLPDAEKMLEHFKFKD